MIYDSCFRMNDLRANKVRRAGIQRQRETEACFKSNENEQAMDVSGTNGR